MALYGARDSVLKPKKIIVKGKLPVHYTIPYIQTTSTSAILSGFDLASHGTANITATSLALQPPYPVKLRFQFGSSAKVATDELKLVGTNATGTRVTDTISIPQTKGSTVDTNNAYGEITTITANAVSDTDDISLGYSTTIGLPYPLATTADIISYSMEASAGTTVSQTGGLTINTTYNTLLVPTATGGHSLQILYKSEVQE